MVRLELLDDIYDMIISNIDHILRHQIVPKFWSYFDVHDDPERGFYQFQLAVCELHKECKRLHKIFRRMQAMIVQLKKAVDVYAEFDAMLKTSLLSQLPYNFNEVVYAFYQTSFKVFANSHQDMGKFCLINIYNQS